MKFTAKYIAEILGGKVEGNDNAIIIGVSKIDDSQPDTLAFLANPKYTQYIYDTKASVVLVNNDFQPEKTINATLIRVEDAYQAFATLLRLYEQMQQQKNDGISSLAFIHQTAQIGTSVFAGEFAYIGKNVTIGNNTQIYPQVYIGDNVTIGNDTILYPGVRIYKQCSIGNRCIVHANTVIGADGFGFAPDSEGRFNKIPQLGNVIIEDDVEIGANTTIDRATMGSTIIRRGVKLDNLIQIGHNVEIGENTVIVAQAGIAGSTKIGKNCMVGGQVGIVGHLTIADEVKIGAQSGLNHSVHQKGAMLFGSPAFDMADSRKSLAVFRRLPDMYRKLGELEKQVQELKKQ